MSEDFSCNYLVDVTGLVGNDENRYFCCHPSGVMCGKEDCPVVIDFARQCRKDAEANDYGSLTRGKLCPLKATSPPVLAFWNLEPAPDIAATLKAIVIQCRTYSGTPRLEYISGRCDGPRCAWYDQQRSAARCHPLHGINDRAPAYSITERAGASLCLAQASDGL